MVLEQSILSLLKLVMTNKEYISLRLTEYDQSHPKLDEIKFVNELCELTGLNRKELFKLVRVIRKEQKKARKVK